MADTPDQSARLTVKVGVEPFDPKELQRSFEQLAERLTRTARFAGLSDDDQRDALARIDDR